MSSDKVLCVWITITCVLNYILLYGVLLVGWSDELFLFSSFLFISFLISPLILWLSGFWCVFDFDFEYKTHYQQAIGLVYKCAYKCVVYCERKRLRAPALTTHSPINWTIRTVIAVVTALIISARFAVFAFLLNSY